MSRTNPLLVIDARPRGPSGPLAGESVLGRPVLDHLIEIAGAIDGGVVAIHAREDEHGRLASLLAARPSARYRFALGPPPEDAAILRSDRVYDLGRLRKALRRGGDPESAVVWRIDRPQALAVAGDELMRRRSYQPLGRFWATRPAIGLARRLAPTQVSPNQVTLASGVLMLGAAALVAFGPGLVLGRILPAIAMALALVLDTADGHLARLQGTASAFGQWLDSSLDELGDMALHAGIAWSAYARSGWAGWLAVGMAYAIGKYLFVFGTQGTASFAASETSGATPATSRLRTVAHWIGHADIRWHIWIVLALVGRLDLALVVYAAYFFARTAGGAMRKAVAHAA